MLPFRLLVAASAVGGLALTGLSPAPAHAADPITDGTIELSGLLNYDGADCTGATEPAPVEAVLTAGTTVKRTLAFDQTATATGGRDRQGADAGQPDAQRLLHQRGRAGHAPSRPARP